MRAYDEDLAYVHDVGFGDFARSVAPGVLEILRRSGITGGLVVDLGCGSGIWARQLVDAGYDVLGIDVSPAMLAIARERVPGADFRQASFVDAELPPAKAVTSLGECLNYRFDEGHGDAALARLFERVHASLEPGGVFVFDVLEPGYAAERGRRGFTQGDDWTVLWTLEEDDDRHDLTRRVTTFRRVGELYRRDEEAHRLRLFDEPELTEILQDLGFRTRAVRGFGRYRFAHAAHVGFIARKARQAAKVDPPAAPARSQDLEAAFRAYGEGHLQGTRELLDALDLRRLNVIERYRAESLLAELRDVATAGRLEHDDDPRLREACRVEVVRDEASLADCLRTFFMHQRATLWLDDDGRRLVVVNLLGGWLFIRVVDVAAGRIVERVSLRPPAPFERPPAPCLDGDRLWVAAMHGGVLELRVGDWDVVGWYPTLELVPGGHTIDFAVVLPGKGLQWMIVRDPESWPEVYAVDLRAWRVTARLPGSAVARPLTGPAGPRVLASDVERGTRIYEQDGTPSGAERLLGRHVNAAAQSPDGRGLLVMTTRGLWAAESGAVAADDPLVTERMKDTGVVLLLIEEEENGASRVFAELDIGDAMVLGDHRLATSLATGLCFAFVTREGSRGEILAIAVERLGEDARLAVAYRVGVPYGSLLLSDRHARHAAVLVFGDETAEVVPLGREAPGVDTPRVETSTEPAAVKSPEIPRPDYVTHCGEPTGDVKMRLDGMLASLQDKSRQELEMTVEALAGEESELEIDDLVLFCLALRETSYSAREKLDAYAGELAGRHPGHPGVALLAANVAGAARRWEEVRRLLGDLEPRGLDDGRARHFCHLKGVALLLTGERDAALAVFEQGLVYEQGVCALEGLVLLTQPMDDPPRPEEWGPGTPRIRRILGALRTADRLVEAGDLAAARELLERPELWRWTDQQLAARLAAVYLETSVATPAERFAKRLALARFLTLFLELDEIVYNKELVLPGLTWERPRLDEIAERAREWLDGG